MFLIVSGQSVRIPSSVRRIRTRIWLVCVFGGRGIIVTAGTVACGFLYGTSRVDDGGVAQLVRAWAS